MKTMTPEELAARLHQKEVDKLKRAVMRKVLGLLKPAVKDAQPVRTGNMRQKTVLKTYKTGEKGAIQVKAWYAKMVEGGTKAHRIPKKGRKPMLIAGGQWVMVVNHPGSKPQPFFDQPLEDNRTKIDALFAAEGENMWKSVIR